MSRKTIIIVAAVFVLFVMVITAVLLLPGSGSKTPQGQVELIWWKTFEDTENVQEIISAYQTLYKNVSIKYVKKDVNTYEAELVEAIASGKGPDILTIHNDWLPKHENKLAPMPANMISVRQYGETFLDVASDDFIKDGKIYAIPMSVDVLALYYNKDILNSVGLSEPPKTWPDVVSAVQKITRQDNNGDFIRSGIAMGLASNVNRAVDIVSLLMLQNGTQFYSENLDVTLDQQLSESNSKYNPAALAVEFYTQFSNPSKKTYTWNARTDNSVDAFSQNKLGMMVSYSYMRERIIDKAPNLNWGVAPVPQVDTTGIKVNFANYWGEAVSKDSKNQEVAWDFIRFLSQKENLAKFYAKHKVPASRKDMIQDQFSDLEIGVFAENVLTAKSVYKTDANSFEGIFVTMIQDVILRGLDPEEAVRNAAQQLRILRRS